LVVLPGILLRASARKGSQELARCFCALSAKLNQLAAKGLYMFDPLSVGSLRSQFRTAIMLAVVADALQIIAFPLFAEGAISPLNDVLDLVVAVALTRLIGWHWEFIPSLVAELLPGVDLVPFWTLAVANVYRKWKQKEQAGDQIDIAPLEPHSRRQV
jgi:hypothetical protein